MTTQEGSNSYVYDDIYQLTQTTNYPASPAGGQQSFAFAQDKQTTNYDYDAVGNRERVIEDEASLLTLHGAH